LAYQKINRSELGHRDFYNRVSAYIHTNVADKNGLNHYLQKDVKILYYEIVEHSKKGGNSLIYINVVPNVRLPESGFFTIRAI
jgi:hypothetical protein